MTETHAESIPFACATCGATFRLEPGTPERCPSCLRTSGLVRQDATPASDRGTWGARQFTIAGVLAVAAVGLAYVLGVTGPAPLAPSPKQAPAAPSMDAIDESLKLTPQAVDGAVRLAAEDLPRDAAGVLSAVRAAVDSGKLPSRDLDGAVDNAPRAAGQLASALTGATAPASGSLEKIVLLGALLDARGLGPITYGIDDDALDSATDIVRRRYLVRAGEGAWLAIDPKPVSDSARALSESELLANILAWRALSDLDREDLVAASKASQTARSLAPADAAVLFVAGQVQILSGLAEPGIATMERAAGIRADTRTWFALGVMAAEANQPFKARQYLLRAADGSRHAEPHLLLAQLALERMATTPKDGHDPLIEEAKGHLERAEATDAEAPGLTTMKAQMAALAGNIEGAEDLLRADTRARPADEEVWLALFQFLLETQREREALETLQTAIDQGVKGATVHHVLGMLLAQDGRTSEAITSLKKALAIEPKRKGGIRLQLAQLVRAEGDEATALALLQEEIALDGGEHRHARLLLAQLHLDGNKAGAAKPLVDAVLAETPDDKEALLVAYLVALKAGQDGQPEKAAALKAIGQRSAIGRVLLEQGFLEEGERVLREALVEAPEDDALAPILLSALLLGTGRGDEARVIRDKTLEKTPEGPKRDELRQLFDTTFAQAKEELERQMPPSGAPAPAAP